MKDIATTKELLDCVLRFCLPILIVIAALSWAITFLAAPPETAGVGYAPEQPILFSHKLHAGTIQMDCEYCHTAVSRSRYAGIPSTDSCMNCHTMARADRPGVQALFKYYIDRRPIPWKRVHTLFESVYFNHSTHINRGVDCQECHGNVTEMETTRQALPISMGTCLSCHRNTRARLPYLQDVARGPENCGACHR